MIRCVLGVVGSRGRDAVLHSRTGRMCTRKIWTRPWGAASRQPRRGDEGDGDDDGGETSRS